MSKPLFWTENERETLPLMMEREQYGWYALIVYWMVCCKCEGVGNLALLLLLLWIPIVFYANKYLNNVQVMTHKIGVIIVYFEVIQFLHYKGAVELPEETSSFLLSSTVVLISNQLSPVLPWQVNLFLVVKHILFWYCCCLGFELRAKVSVYFLSNLCWAVYHIHTRLTIKGEQVKKPKVANIRSPYKKETHISALYDALPDGILVMTEEEKVVSYNSMLLTFLGLPKQLDAEEHIFTAISLLKYDPEYATDEYETAGPVIRDILTYIASERTDQAQFGIVLRDGKFLEWRANKLAWDLKKACIVCVRDVTHWVELESIAKRESTGKSALIRSVSHELRTPTNAIINFAQDIKNKEELDPEVRQSVTMLANSAQFLLSMINDLLDCSSFTNGKFGLTKQFFSLKDTVQECVQLIELQCRHKKLELIVRYDPLLPAQAYNDKNRLKQVILNLLSNALKFTITGKIEVVAVSVSETHAGIRVTDTGVGISKESLEKIFTLFGKLEGNEKLNPQGCGLGLSISSILVKSMGGSGIQVTSQRHVGSTFAFDFNITHSNCLIQAFSSQFDTSDFWEDASKMDIPDAISEKAEKSYPDILIADDVDFNRIVLRTILESVGYDCDEATNGAQVLQLVTSRANTGKPYLVILMDVEMPEMDGITATRELSAMASRGDILTFPAIIGCSAYSSMEDRDMCLKAGMHCYLEKPIIREILYDILSTLVPRNPARRRLQSTT